MLSHAASASHLATPAAPSHSTIAAHFQELKQELHSFNESFAMWLTEKRRALGEDKQAYLKTLADEQGPTGSLLAVDAVEGLKKQYAQLQQKKVQVQQEEQRELDEGKSINEELCAQQQFLTKKLEQLKAQQDALSQSIQRESTTLAQKERMREAHAKKTRDLVALYQQHLGLYVDPLDAELTRFTFVNIDPDNCACRFTFTISVANGSYEISRLDPPLPDVDALQARLNETNDFFAFLKAIRKLFKATVALSN